MYPIKVVSLGPGAPAYILPVALDAIREAEVILCGRRHLESFDARGKEVLLVGSGGRPLSELMAYARAVYKTRRTAVVVSGDCGFYSLLSYTKRVIPAEDVVAIPGISSLQYFFAKLKMPWQDAQLMSLHGRNQDLIARLSLTGTVGVLTDGEHNSAYIARVLKDAGYDDKWIYVGEELSYPEERITKLSVEEALTFQEKGMSVVIIADE